MVVVVENATKPSRFALLTRCTIPCACHVKRQLNLQKWSGPLVFLTFSLRNVLCSSLFYSSLFYSSLLSDLFHLCSSSVHTVGSLTSKLPSTIGMYKLESKLWLWKYDFWEIPTPIEGEGGGGTKPTWRIPVSFTWKPWDSDPTPQMEL